MNGKVAKVLNSQKFISWYLFTDARHNFLVVYVCVLLPPGQRVVKNLLWAIKRRGAFYMMRHQPRARRQRVFARAALSLQSLKIKRPADLLYDLITLSQLNSCVLYLRAAEITAANQRPNLIAPDLPSFLHNARTRHTLWWQRRRFWCQKTKSTRRAWMCILVNWCYVRTPE